MDQQSRAKLETEGWQIGTAADFLSLTSEDLLLIEIKLVLAHRLEERQRRSLDQKTTSHQLTHPNQPIETENNNSSNSIDQLIRDMIATGASPQEIGKLIAGIDAAVA